MKYLPFLYGAYGSNLNMKQMSRRCPDAIKQGTHVLKDWRLVFRGVADIERSEGDEVSLGIWKITSDCLTMLDLYEGFPHLYSRTMVESIHSQIIPSGPEPKKMPLMVYTMVNTRTITAPSDGYLKSIVDGYDDFGIKRSLLEPVLDHAYTETSMKSTRSKIQII